jgi:hypothetical protein
MNTNAGAKGSVIPTASSCIELYGVFSRKKSETLVLPPILPKCVSMRQASLSAQHRVDARNVDFHLVDIGLLLT